MIMIDDDDKWKRLKQTTSISTYYYKNSGFKITQQFLNIT